MSHLDFDPDATGTPAPPVVVTVAQAAKWWRCTYRAARYRLRTGWGARVSARKWRVNFPLMLRAQTREGVARV